MAGWNGSGMGGSSAPIQPKAKAKKPSPIRGLVAGGLVCVLAIGAYFAFFASSDKPQKETAAKERGRIKEVTPAAAPTSKVEMVVTEVKKKPHSKYIEHDPDKVYKDERGVLRWKKGNGRVRLSDEEMEKYVVHHTAYDTGLPKFKYNCEMEIATLLTLEPGDMIFGDIERDKHWQKEFMQSLLDPTPIEETDSENDRRIKEAVEATKKDLVKRMKAGEDLGQILSDARDEMRRLATYKDELLQIAKETSGEIQTAEEVSAHLEAVNKMLESKGLAPVKESAIVSHKILREINNAKAQAEGGNKEEK